MQILAMGFIKLSFIFFFRRIFVTGGTNVFRTISSIMIVLVIAWMLSFFFWFCFSCGIHFSSRWTTLNSLHQDCSTDVKSDLALAISDFLTDVLVLTLPIPMVSGRSQSTTKCHSRLTGITASYDAKTEGCCDGCFRTWYSVRKITLIIILSGYLLIQHRAMVASIIRLSVFVYVTKSEFLSRLR